MHTKNQITLIKLSFLLTIVGSVALRLDIFREGFIEGWKGTGDVKAPSLLEAFVAFTGVYFGLKILINLFRFINSVQKENIFDEKNVTRLTSMGWSSITLSFLLYIFYFLKTIVSFSMDSVYKAIELVDFDFWLIIFGITLLTIGFVFKKGIELQQEQDLTI
ncbi:DUF2975 domain-containing protein [Pedobacter frigiditerrae]|uniref:DUF2975 domain-containing protein n=1 Tax=Pedobacter frigiditerrae TaxID=2530452 RepID=A0A4R0MXB5_9SPHI|nr:DUF2975 domain-containing protein [Pedobacter frigiditerrae]TCC91870.1 DUF2975 domain-containing protein [Pedobacter frigiditerrae]